MSDRNPPPDPMPDPIDQAYAAAQALLDDDAARAARRASVLAAVARETAPRAPAARPGLWRPTRRRYAGWLTAASVAGLGAFLTFQLAPPFKRQPDLAPSAPAAAPAAPPVIESGRADAVTPVPVPAQAPPPVSVAAPAATTSPLTTPDVAVRAERRASRDEPPPAVLTPAPSPQSAFPASEERSDIAPKTYRFAPPSQVGGAAAVTAEAAAPASPAVAGARLRAAATAGRTAELQGLLSQGAAVDTPDAAGETALMKAVQARRPAAVALLRRHGADLDRENRAGASARDMAKALDDPALNRALGLAP